jgi:hypothetical protein
LLSALRASGPVETDGGIAVLRLIPHWFVLCHVSLHLAAVTLRCDVVELDEEHAFASPMPCHLKEIGDAGEAAFVGETRGDLFERDRDDGIDLNLTFFEAVSPAGTNVRTHPDTNASRDRATSHAIAQVFREQHRASLARISHTPGGVVETLLP